MALHPGNPEEQESADSLSTHFRNLEETHQPPDLVLSSLFASNYGLGHRSSFDGPHRNQSMGGLQSFRTVCERKLGLDFARHAANSRSNRASLHTRQRRWRSGPIYPNGV